LKHASCLLVFLQQPLSYVIVSIAGALPRLIYLELHDISIFHTVKGVAKIIKTFSSDPIIKVITIVGTELT